MGKHIKAEYDCQKLGETITQKGFTREKFANMTGASVNSIASIISGKRTPSVTLNKVICLTLGVPEDTFLVKPEPPKPEPPTEPVPDNHALEESVDKLIVYLDRMERKQDRLEMLIRSVQNENLALRQALLKRK